MAEQKPEHNDDPTETQSTTPAEEEQVEVTEAATAPEDAELTLEEEVERLEADLAEAKDAALRAQADAANVQRRAEQEIDKARKFALDRFVGELLPVVDNMERALSAAADSDADASDNGRT